MATEYRTEEVRAGLLVLLAIIIFLVFVFAIAGLGFKTETKTFYARFGYTNGIQAGSVVRLAGMLVGEVDRVYFPDDDPTKIEVIMRVRANAPVKETSEAYITSIGIMGDYYIEITPGTQDSPFLPDKSILTTKDVPSLTQMGVRLGEPLDNITQQLESLLVRLNTLLDEKNTVRISNVLTSLDTILHQNRGNATQLTQNLVDATAKMERVLDRVDRLMESNEGNITETLGELRASMTRADSLMGALATTSDKLNYMLSSNELVFHEVMQSLDDASKNFEVFSRRIKEQPWSLIRKDPLPERKIPQN